MTTGVMRLDGRRDGGEGHRAAAARAGEGFTAWFLADWREVLFVHYAFEPGVLRPHAPFELDLFDGCAWVSLVAFTQRRLRPARGGRWTSWVTAPVARHAFLNLRAYVRGADGTPGICFLAEWIPNRLARVTGPALYGMPFRLAEMAYVPGRREVRADGGTWRADYLEAEAESALARAGTAEAFLLERYTAYTERNGLGRRFDIRHEPWAWRPAAVRVRDDSLIGAAAPWFGCGRLGGAHVSEGVDDVCIGGPRVVERSSAAP
jgi:hypothetical protein